MAGGVFLCAYVFALQVAFGSISCATGTDNAFFQKECSHSKATITLLRRIPGYGKVTSVNYFIVQDSQNFVPITVDVCRNGERLAAFQCENGSILDKGATIGEVIFKGWCEDPTVMINHNVTVSISLDLHVILSDVDHACSTVTIGPQRIGLLSRVDSESREPAPFLKLLNVDTCNRIGPAVPIRLSTSTNASIVLHPDGSNETVGDISVWPLPCSDSHTQEYGVSVPSTDNYTLYGEIINSLLPISCIFVPVSVLAIMEPTNSTTPPTNQPYLSAVISTATILLIGSLVVLTVIFGMILLCKHRRNSKTTGVNGAGGSETGTTGYPEAPTSLICSVDFPIQDNPHKVAPQSWTQLQAQAPSHAIDVPMHDNPAYKSLEVACQSNSQEQGAAPAQAIAVDVPMYDNPAYESVEVVCQNQAQAPAGVEEVIVPMYDNPAYESIELAFQTCDLQGNRPDVSNSEIYISTHI